MSELPEGIAAATPPTPRESAAGILLRSKEGAEPELLLGTRSRRSRFMPGALVFPGGVIDPGDRPDDPDAHRRCITREMREEAGIDVPDASWVPAGLRVTPAIFPVRFRTEFFVAPLPVDWCLPETPPSPDEIDRLELRTAAAVIADWQREKIAVPPPVLPVLRTIAEHGRTEIDELARLIADANALEQHTPRIEFFPDVWMLPLRTATLPPATHTNVWMPGGRRFVIVDPGSAEPSELERLERAIRRRVETGGVADSVLLTHAHGDHVAGAAAIARRLELPVRAHPEVLGTLSLLLDGLETAGLVNGDRLELGGLTLEAIETPGHAPGHLAYYLPEPRLLVAGDLLSGISTILIDPDTGDMQAYLDSLRRVERLSVRALLPGHGPPLPGKAVSRLLAHREARESRILEALAVGPLDLRAVARVVYDDVPQMPHLLTGRQTLAHLLRLESIGQVRRQDELWEVS